MRRKAAKKETRATLSPERVASIAEKRKAAKLRNVAKAAAPTEPPPIDLSSLDAVVGKDEAAPTTAPRLGGRQMVSRSWKAEKPANLLEGPNAWTWPNDLSLSMKYDTHRKAG